jgi:DNA replication protein DnaC
VRADTVAPPTDNRKGDELDAFGLLRAIVKPADPAFMAGLTTNELLILDDLGQEHPNEFVRTKLFGLIDGRYNAGLPTIITTNQSEQEIKARLGPAAISRIYEMCDPYVVNATDYRPAMANRRRAG